MANSEKVSVTLPRLDLVFLDEYMKTNGTSRSGALHDAVRALRDRSLEEAYRQADEEWIDSGEAEVWVAVVGDGLPS